MTILYSFIVYFLLSFALILFLWLKFKKKQKKIEENLQKMEKTEFVEITVEQPKEEIKVEEPKVEQKVEEPKSEVNFEKIENPDKNKPFARISSPSVSETHEYEQTVEKVPEVTPPKQKRKYTKKAK